MNEMLGLAGPHAGTRPVETAALLSLLDAIDRFNTLFLEIRQLQTTLLHQLRLPELMAVLRHEELFLWGTAVASVGIETPREPDQGASIRTSPNSWIDAMRHVRDIHRDSTVMARCWIARFPHPEDGDGPVGQSGSEADLLPPDHHLAEVLDTARQETLRLTGLAGQIMGEAGRGGFLTAELRRLYHILTALQILKQNLLREKITLAFYGLRAFAQLGIPHGADNRQNGHHHLLMTCVAVRYQLSHRVLSLRNLQRQVEQIVDPAFDQDPRPIASRRRDQGMFSIAILDRLRTTHDRLRRLMYDLGLTDKYMRSDRHPLVMHRWDIAHTSRWHVDHDSVMAASDWDPEHPTDIHAYTTIANVVSSYWMPDRPDLWPQLAHELAHVELRSRVGGLRSEYLAHSNGAFCRLLKRLTGVMERTRHVMQGQGWPWLVDAASESSFTIEIASDLLAAAVTGPGYAFMAMLDFLGVELTSLFMSDTSGGEVDFGISFTTGIYESLDRLKAPQLWIVRLRCLTAYLSLYLANGKIPQDKPALGQNVLDALNSAVDTILGGLIQRASMDTRVRLSAWDEMAREMSRVIQNDRDSKEFVDAAIAASGREAETHHQGKDALWERESLRSLAVGALFDRLMENPRLLHITLLRNNDIRDRLTEENLLPAGKTATAAEIEAIGRQFKIWLMKRNGGDGTFAELVIRTFCCHYLPGQPNRIPPELFCNVYDIPWQSAMITSVDLLPSVTEIEDFQDRLWLHELSRLPFAWFRAIERMSWLGREYFNLALEFQVWNERIVRARHDACVRVVQGLLADALAFRCLFAPNRRRDLRSMWREFRNIERTGSRARTLRNGKKSTLREMARQTLNVAAKLSPQPPLVSGGFGGEIGLARWLADARALALETPNNWSGFASENMTFSPTKAARKWDEDAKGQILSLLKPRETDRSDNYTTLVDLIGRSDPLALVRMICERIHATINEARRDGAPVGAEEPENPPIKWNKAPARLAESLDRRWQTLQHYVAWAEEDRHGRTAESTDARPVRDRRDLYNKVGCALGGVFLREKLINQGSSDPPVPLTVSRTFRIERVSFHSRLSPASGSPGPLDVLGTTPWYNHTDSRGSPAVGLSEATPLSVGNCIPLLGRYDMIRIEEARPTAPQRLPNLRVADWYKGWSYSPGHALRHERRGDAWHVAETVPLFVRQQFGLPFSKALLSKKHSADYIHFRSPSETVLRAQLAWCNMIQNLHPDDWDSVGAFRQIREIALESFTPLPIERDMETGKYRFLRAHLPIAVISVQLAQRSGRLTLVRQLLEDNDRWAEFCDYDTGFLIDGWGDILLLLHLDLTKELNDEPEFASLRVLPGSDDPLVAEPTRVRCALEKLRHKVAMRIDAIMELKSALYDHFLVSRTETAFAPIVADVALDAMSEKSVIACDANGLELQNAQIRMVADRVTGDVSHHVEDAIHAWRVRRRFGQRQMRLVAQAGSYDYGLRFNRAGSQDMANMYLHRLDGDELLSQVQCLADIRRRLRRITPGNDCGGLLYVSGYARLMEDALGDARHLVDKIQTTMALDTTLNRSSSAATS